MTAVPTARRPLSRTALAAAAAPLPARPNSTRLSLNAAPPPRQNGTSLAGGGKTPPAAEINRLRQQVITLETQVEQTTEKSHN